MRLTKKSSVIAGSAAVALGLVGPVLVGQAATAAPTAPAIKVNPSTGLKDGQSVDVSVSGFKGSEDLFVVQCAMPKPKEIACDLKDGAMFKTDGKGGGSTKVTVHSSYQSQTPDGKSGPKVDCAKIQGGCVLGAGNMQSKELAGAPIKFG